MAKAESLRVVCFVGMNVVPLWPQTHRQNVVSKVSGFAPHGSKRDMTADQIFIGERFNPREAIRVGPYRVVNACEVSIEAAASFLQKMRQEKRHLVHRERELARPGFLVPHFRMWRCVDWLGHKLIPGIREDAALSRD